MVTLDELQRPGEPTVQAGDYVRLTVHDTGPGLDELTRRHIFEPFFSTKGHARGLGLASCYGIIKQLGGHIRAHGGETHGTTFEILLKRALELPKRAEEGLRNDRAAGGATVLLAEDDELVRSSLTRALRDQGYVVLAAEDGEAALALAAQYGSAIDILISDVVMPRLGGFELAKQLRQTRPELPILFVSGYSDQRPPLSDGTKAPSRFLEKPYKLNELAKTVTELLAQARSKRSSSVPAQR